MSQSGWHDRYYTVSSLCELFGIFRQGYYKHRTSEQETDILISSVVHYCHYIRQELPRAGARQLYCLSKEYFADKFTLGRDRFYDVLRSNEFMLRRKRFKPRTTNSNHPYRIYKDLLNQSPKYVAQDNCRLMVADITYVNISDGFVYLSLLTDSYSRLIVGFALHRTLGTSGPLEALKMAFGFYQSYGMCVKGIIHHSDRGVQYASKDYVSTLLDKGARISMTQTGDPLHNALAERMNNTIKNGWLYQYADKSFEQAQQGVKQAVYNYNWMRPHKALGMKTPMQMLPGQHLNPLLLGPGISPGQATGK